MRRSTMASVHDEETKAFCNDVYSELESIRLRIEAVKNELAMTYGEQSEPFKSYERHLVELSDAIGWKLQILSHSCPYDWKGSVENVDTVVSIPDPGVAASPEFSGGYVGG
jgi:hypothetical protein